MTIALAFFYLVFTLLIVFGTLWIWLLIEIEQMRLNIRNPKYWQDKVKKGK